VLDSVEYNVMTTARELKGAEEELKVAKRWVVQDIREATKCKTSLGRGRFKRRRIGVHWSCNRLDSDGDGDGRETWLHGRDGVA
jgi:hypothetical protein